MEGNQNGGLEGTSSMDRCGQSPVPGLAQPSVLVLGRMQQWRESGVAGERPGTCQSSDLGLGRGDGTQHPPGTLGSGGGYSWAV